LGHASTVGPAGSNRLHDEQRVALRLTPEPFRVRAGQCGPGQPLGQCGGSVRGSPREVDLGEPVHRADPPEQFGQRRVGLDLLAAGGRDDQQARVGSGAQQVVQELQRLPITPVGVVGDQ